MQERGATIIYATHIFDGMEKWASHLAFVSDGELKKGGPSEEMQDLNQGRRLLDVMTDWLRVDAKERKAKGKKEAGGGGAGSKAFTPFMPSKHMAFFR